MDQKEKPGKKDSGGGQEESDQGRGPNPPGDDEGHGPSQIEAETSASIPPTKLKRETSVKEGEVNETRDPLHVSLPVYDGPLDLLLELIKKNEMNIYDIAIAEITRQYLETLAQMKRLDLEIAGEFLVMAATLVYIKSKMLLPQEGAKEEEEGGDPRAELVRKLLEYQAFKEAAKELELLEGERAKMFTRQVTDYYLADLDADDVGIDTFSANLYDLVSAFQVVLAKARRKEPHEVYEEQVSIEERIEDIRKLLAEKNRVLFSELFSASKTRNYLITTFLALLEVMRMKIARAIQKEQFGEIVLERI